MGSKHKKPKIKQATVCHEQKAAPQPSSPPRRKWWNKLLDTNKLKAAGTIGSVIVLVVIFFFQSREWHHGHRPRVVFSRPPQFLQPFSCNIKENGHLDASEGESQLWIKNLGTEAHNVFPFWYSTAFLPDRKASNFIERMIVNDSTCEGTITDTFGTFPLSPGEEMTVKAGGTFSSNETYVPEEPIQLFESHCVYYIDPDDWWSAGYHATCATYRFQLSNGQFTFRCNGQPIDGRFTLYLSGHCAS